MSNEQTHLNYREAIHMIRVGRYEESLALLEVIDAERPNVKNVLYPMAVCCERLGRIRESYALCSRLVEEYNHEKAQAIKARLELLIHPEEMPEDTAASKTPPNTDFSPPDEPGQAAPEQTPQAKRHRMPLWMALVIAMAAAAGTAALLYAFLLRA